MWKNISLLGAAFITTKYKKRSLRRRHSLLHYVLSLYFSKDSKELVALIRAFLFHGKLSASNYFG